MNFINKVRLSLSKKIYIKHLIQIVNFLLLGLVFFFSISIERIRPFNYVAIVLFGLFAGLTLVYYFAFVSKFELNLPFILAMVLMVTFLVSFIVNINNGFPRTPLLMVLFFIFIYLWAIQQKHYWKFYILFFNLMAFLFLILFFIVESKNILSFNFEIRNGQTFGNANDIARNLAYCSTLFYISFLVFKKPLIKTFFILLGVVSVFFIVFTGSISNILLSTLVLLVVIFFAVPKKFRLLYIIGIVLFAVLVWLSITYIPVLEPIKKRILSIFNTFTGVDSSIRTDSSTVGRFNAAIYGFKLFLTSPLFGNGYNSVVKNYTIMAHNNLAEISADYGIFALIAEETLILSPVIFNLRNKKLHLAVISTLFMFLIQFFLVCFNSKTDIIFLALTNAYLVDFKFDFNSKNESKNETVNFKEYFLIDI